MTTIICKRCMEIYEDIEDENCPVCGANEADVIEPKEDEEKLRRQSKKLIKERKESGLDGLVGDLEAIIVNTEPENQKDAIMNYLRWTNYRFREAFETDAAKTAVLELENSADILIRSRKKPNNPFLKFNNHPKSKHVPNTRLETFIFNIKNLSEYKEIQKNRNKSFLQDKLLQGNDFKFLQTPPSEFTGNSYGFIESGGDISYRTQESRDLDWSFNKPKKDYLRDIKYLDHAATRVKSQYKNPAILEFLDMTNYEFDFSIYVDTFNSITSVARLSLDDFGMVFTSGIKPIEKTSLEEAGPTEQFTYNYGPRTHHHAFHTENIEKVFKEIKKEGMEFLVELVGGPDQGLYQTFTESFDETLLINEYIHRFGDFEGFFARKNVTKLTKATKKQ